VFIWERFLFTQWAVFCDRPDCSVCLRLDSPPRQARWGLLIGPAGLCGPGPADGTSPSARVSTTHQTRPDLPSPDNQNTPRRAGASNREQPPPHHAAPGLPPPDNSTIPRRTNAKAASLNKAQRHRVGASTPEPAPPHHAAPGLPTENSPHHATPRRGACPPGRPRPDYPGRRSHRTGPTGLAPVGRKGPLFLRCHGRDPGKH
jgi:hypothetical protein